MCVCVYERPGLNVKSVSYCGSRSTKFKSHDECLGIRSPILKHKLPTSSSRQVLSLPNSALPQLAVHSWFYIQTAAVPPGGKLQAWLLASQTQSTFEEKHGTSSHTFQGVLPFLFSENENLKQVWEQKCPEPKMEFCLKFCFTSSTPSRTISENKWSNCLHNGSPLPVHKYLHLWHSRSPSASDW